MIAAVSAKDGRDWLLGFGADLDPATAASKALTEMNQMLPAALAGRAPAIATAELSDCDFLRPSHEYAVLTPVTKDPVEIARSLGLEVLTLDRTGRRAASPSRASSFPGSVLFGPVSRRAVFTMSPSVSVGSQTRGAKKSSMPLTC